jgi:hypothetical protein
MNWHWLLIKDLYAFNISKLDLAQNQLLNKIIQDYEATAMELLGLLENLSKKGRLPSVMQGRHDTAIGRTIEYALGIPINSSPFPDYKGIELKAGRLNKIKSYKFIRSSPGLVNQHIKK